ncbi:hypothetical protein [Streptomyces sp. NPDC056527]|uniref:hypothetical protein n=1 Tax=Streptomyces sp. NPDC056527 TaxID=3345853 RepID=UPI003683C529
MSGTSTAPTELRRLIVELLGTGGLTTESAVIATGEFDDSLAVERVRSTSRSEPGTRPRWQPAADGCRHRAAE